MRTPNIYFGNFCRTFLCSLLACSRSGQVCLLDSASEATSDGTFHAALELPASKTHSGAVSSGCWYSADTGMFLTGGSDGNVQAWDSNTGSSAFTFAANKHVNHLSMPAAAAKNASPLHTVCAVCTSGKAVKLLDLRIAAPVAHLSASDSSVLQAAWSHCRPHLLATAAADGTVFFWDARRSGLDACVGQLDHEQQQRRSVAAAGGSSSAVPPPTGARRLSSALKQRIVARARGGMTSLPRDAGGPVGFAFKPHMSHTAHAGAASSVTFLPKEASSTEAVLTTGSDNTVRLWHSDSTGCGNRWRLGSCSSAGVASAHKLGCQPGILLLPSPMAGTAASAHSGSVDVCVLHPNTCSATTGAGGAAGTGDSTGGVAVLNMREPDQVMNLWGGHLGTVTHVQPNAARCCVYTAGQDGSIVCRRLRATLAAGDSAPAAPAEAAAWGDLL